MLPTPEEFEKKVTQLGVQNSDHIVIYDHSNGQFVASARVWWSFRVSISSPRNPCLLSLLCSSLLTLLSASCNTYNASVQVFGHHKVSVLAQGFEGWPNGLQIPPEDSNKVCCYLYWQRILLILVLHWPIAPTEEGALQSKAHRQRFGVGLVYSPDAYRSGLRP